MSMTYLFIVQIPWLLLNVFESNLIKFFMPLVDIKSFFGPNNY
jgi:hypothetical protein